MGTAVDVTELLAGLTHCRCVQNRQHLGEVRLDEGVGQDGVGVVERAQEDVAFEIAVQAVERVPRPVHLFGHRLDPGGQEAGETEHVAFGRGEGGALVEPGFVENRPAAKRRRDRRRCVSRRHSQAVVPFLGGAGSHRHGPW